ncbi:MAG: hypothetical protein GXO60_05580 [Epsilonproteobacteria bacterium]|nr:hypothetical protein [Campylobacterota bacterium]
MRKLLSLSLILYVLIFTGCPFTEDNDIWYDGYKICNLSSVIKDENGSLYINGENSLYEIRDNNITKSNKDFRDIFLDIEQNRTDLPSASEIVDLITSNHYSNLDEVRYYNLFGLSADDLSYIFAVVSYNTHNNSFIDELVLLQETNGSLYLKDHIVISRASYSDDSGFSPIDDFEDIVYPTPIFPKTTENKDFSSMIKEIIVNSRYYLLVSESNSSSSLYDNMPKLITLDIQNQKLKPIELSEFIDSYYHQNIDFIEIFDYLKSSVTEESGIFDGINYSIYPEGLYITYSSNIKIKNSNLNEKMGPKPEGIYKAMYRFYPKDEYPNFIELQIPIDRNCSEEFF